MSTLSQLVKTATGIACDSRDVKPGFIFVAIRGRVQDGNAYIPDAERRGAMAIVSDHPAPPKAQIPIFAVANARQALAGLAAKFYRHPSRDINVIGVTGTNGKTTIACMLEHIFSQTGLKCGLIGTVKVNTGRHSFPSKLTTPDAVSIQHYLSQMRSSGVSHAAIEVSAQGIDMHRVDDVRFSCGVLSNICPDHLDFHGDFAGYFAAKKRFLDLLQSNVPLIINSADPLCRKLAAGYHSQLVTAAVGEEANIAALLKDLSSYGSRFEIKISSLTTIAGRPVTARKFTVYLPIPGRHNIENALLASAAALLHGVSPENIVRALTNFRSVERRMNVFHFHGRTILDDTALNPGSIDAVFNTLVSFRCQRMIVVNAIRGCRGPAINTANAATLARWRKNVDFSLVITSSVGTVEPPDRVSFEEKLAFLGTLENNQVPYTYFSNLDAAVTAAFKDSRPGDLIVLLGAQGMDEGRRILTRLTTAEEALQCAATVPAVTEIK